MRMVVCGGGTGGPRRETVFKVLDFLTAREHVEVLIHRGACGSERLAELWAAEHEIASLRLPAQPKKRGRLAGPIRDLQLLHLKPDLLVLFPDARTTERLVAGAKDAGVMIARASERGEVAIEAS